MRSLCESSAGIAEYVSPGGGFTALIKSRYADFQVNEINSDGEIAKLTNQNVPCSTVKTEQKNKEEMVISSKYNLEVLPMETWDKMNTLALIENDRHEKLEIDASMMTKEMRTAVHNAVKKAFGRKIISSTVTVGDKKIFKFTNFIKGDHIDTREKWKWKGEYVHFVLYKENCDTMDAASQIADRLHMKNVNPAVFGYCGTKDRRAKTSQWFSLKKVDPNKIVRSCKPLRNIRVGNFQFKDYNLKLGQLKGNRFRIALRNVVAPNEVVSSSVENLKNNGFINYYGLQRFGSRVDVPTFFVGKQLLLGNFKEAVDLILEPQGQFFEALKKYKETNNAQCALSGITKFRNCIELKLLQALRKEEGTGKTKDYVNALNKLPRNTRLLYIHSYQSWIWNQCVSERLRKFGLKCHKGDLVYTNSALLLDDFTGISDYNELNVEDDYKDNNEEALDSISHDYIKENESFDDKVHKNLEKGNIINLQKTEVKVLTQNDIDSGSYSIFDIVMPLPGFDIEYPPNMKDYYEELLKKDNLNLDLKQKNKNFSLSGAYRHIVTKPEDISWNFVQYTDPFCDLIASDLDVLQNKNHIQNVPDGKFKAFIIEFNLPPSTYATMALRELLKMDTSCEVQSQNNDYYKEVSSNIDNVNILNSHEKSEKRAKEDDTCVIKKLKTV